VVQAFLNDHATFEPLSLPNLSTSNEPADLANPAVAIRTWPHRNDVDGFFMIAFQRRA
jgi:16S rRNA C967 or C1407 C5-methylase (RsmB/RsmF family)